MLPKSKRFLTSFSLSPSHFDNKSEELTEKNVELLASVATAFARNDLPVPGGPYNKIPCHGFRLPVNKCGNLIGKITASFKDSLAFSKPATSVHSTFGFSITIAPKKKIIKKKDKNLCITLISIHVPNSYQTYKKQRLIY